MSQEFSFKRNTCPFCQGIVAEDYTFFNYEIGEGRSYEEVISHIAQCSKLYIDNKIKEVTNGYLRDQGI